MSGGTIDYEPIVLVTRGDELPKKNYEKKVHPTYEVEDWSNFFIVNTWPQCFNFDRLPFGCEM